jgi:hypothetical protein
MSGAIPPLPNTPSWRGAQLKDKHRDNFTCTFTYKKQNMLVQKEHRPWLGVLRKAEGGVTWHV